MIAAKRFVLTLAIVLITTSTFCLDMTDIQHSLAGVFLDLVDVNEGMTGFRSLNITSGGREESLAGAFVGLSDDICFFDHNPAASCLLKNGEVAVFHNSWIADSNVETLAWVDRFKDTGIGAKIKCFYVPFTQYNYFGDRISGGYYTETTGTFNMSHNFFHGYYFKGLAIGGNFKVGWRSIPNYADSETDQLIEKSGLEQSSVAVMADLGVMLRFNLGKMFYLRAPNLCIGLSLTNLGAALTGFGGSVVVDDPLPSAINIGASYRILKPLAVTADFKKPINLMDFANSESWSAGIGIDVTVTNFMEVMSGFRLQGGNPRISLGTEFKVKKLVFDLNYTLDLTTSFTTVNRFSLSARVETGDKGRLKQEMICDELYTNGLDEYARGNYEAAVACWQAALEANSAFTPARRWIDTVRTSQKLYKRVLDLQTLD